jgi:hypothetical protein
MHNNDVPFIERNVSSLTTKELIAEEIKGHLESVSRRIKRASRLIPRKLTKTMRKRTRMRSSGGSGLRKQKNES